jgi:hypothetical protein
VTGEALKTLENKKALRSMIHVRSPSPRKTLAGANDTPPASSNGTTSALTVGSHPATSAVA